MEQTAEGKGFPGLYVVSSGGCAPWRVSDVCTFGVEIIKNKKSNF
jgi:ABC-type transporter MlaC component